jgi:hypothetical protein
MYVSRQTSTLHLPHTHLIYTHPSSWLISHTLPSIISLTPPHPQSRLSSLLIHPPHTPSSLTDFRWSIGYHISYVCVITSAALHFMHQILLPLLKSFTVGALRNLCSLQLDCQVLLDRLDTGNSLTEWPEKSQCILVNWPIKYTISAVEKQEGSTVNPLYIGYS